MKSKKNTGNLLVILALFIVIVILVVGILNFTSSNHSLVTHSINSTRAYYFAHVGVMEAIGRIKVANTASFAGWVWHDQPIDVIIDSTNPPVYIITSSCTVSSATKRIRATISSSGGSATISTWENLAG